MAVLIAIPVYNEIKYVAAVLAETQKYNEHVLFVDDASTDGTSDFLQQHAARLPGVHVVRHADNSGYGRSIIDAFDFAAARGFDWVITMDCDEQHEPQMIPHFKRAIETDAWDVISGTRYTAESAADDAAPGSRRLINMTITSVINDLFGWQLTDTFCGFKAHRTTAMTKLGLDEAGYAFPLQLWPRLYEAGLRVTELPVKRIYNDPNRTFGVHLDDADRRLRHYMGVLKAELLRIGHASADCVDDITLDDPHACCGCEHP